MEACFVNLLEPGDTAIIGVNGVFGERMCEVARRCGAEVVRVDAPWGRAIDPQQLLDAQRANPHARLLAVVHAETSTGVENEIAPLAALQQTDTLLLVDTVTSLGGIPVDVDGWGIDAVYSGTQKCLGVPPGLSPRELLGPGRRAGPRPVAAARSRGISTSACSPTTSAPRAATTTPRRSRCSTRCTPDWVSCSKRVSTPRTPGTGTSGGLLQDALPELGFRPFALERPLPQLTSVWLPDGVDDAKVRARAPGAVRHRGRRWPRRTRGQGLAHRAYGSFGARALGDHAARGIGHSPVGAPWVPGAARRQSRR